MDDLVGPGEVRPTRGVAGDIERPVVVLDLPNVDLLGVDRGAREDLVHLRGTQRVAFDSGAARDAGISGSRPDRHQAPVPAGGVGLPSQCLGPVVKASSDLRRDVVVEMERHSLMVRADLFSASLEHIRFIRKRLPKVVLARRAPAGATLIGGG